MRLHKYYYLIPFTDMVYDWLERKEYDCFLDVDSGYKHILIDQANQENTMSLVFMVYIISNAYHIEFPNTLMI